MRIKRSASEIPRFIQWELARNVSYRRRISLEEAGVDVLLEYRRSRFHWLGDEPDGIRKREIFGWLKIGRRRVAALQLFEFETTPWLSNTEFFEFMDIDEQIESHLAEILIDAWENVTEQITSFGNLVDFRMAWSDPSLCPPHLWAKAVNLLIQQELGDYSILTMKAFPLEYEGRMSKGSLAEYGLQKRQLAMVRHYRRLFGVIPFPGKVGNDGWLYKIAPRLRELIPPPGFYEAEATY